MSKELKALKELRKEIVGAYYHDMEWFNERYDIIETALKEYEGAKNHIKALNKERIDNEVKLKVLDTLIKIFKINGGFEIDEWDIDEEPYQGISKEEYNIMRNYLMKEMSK